jgi:S1-C subfamily serine protease
MRYRLRTLLILLAIGPPILAPLSVWGWREYLAWRSRQPTQIPGTGYLGAQMDDAAAAGVKVLSVRPGGPAEAGGLLKGDVITSINRRPCRDMDDFDAAFSQLTVGNKLRMVVSRNGKSQAVVVTVGKRKDQH